MIHRAAHAGFTSLAAAIENLGADGERLLAEAHVRGAIALIGCRHDGSTVGTHAKIPPEVLAANVRLNAANNCIEANADTVNFAEFEHAVLQHLRWESVKVATHELSALKKSLDGRQTSLAKSETDCQEWIASLMRDTPSPPKPKSHYWIEAREKFSKLSYRGFDRAWRGAVEQTGRRQWSTAGRRKQARA